MALATVRIEVECSLGDRPSKAYSKRLYGTPGLFHRPPKRRAYHFPARFAKSTTILMRLNSAAGPAWSISFATGSTVRSYKPGEIGVSCAPCACNGFSSVRNSMVESDWVRGISAFSTRFDE